MTPPAARLLDLGRLAGRAGRVLTGVDRVELAYLNALAADPVPAFALVRTAAGYLLLDRAGMRAFAAAVAGGDWPQARLLDRMARRGDPLRAGVERFLRRHAIARCPHGLLALMLGRRLPAGISHVNVGQTSLHPATLEALRRHGARIAVMVHDTIPLDHPGWQRPGTVAQFAGRIALAARMADLVLCPGAGAADGCRRHMAAAGRLPPMATVALGVTLARPDSAALPPGLDLSRPWFVALNTIEPRKNHALLLDVWEMLGPDPPPLFILGARGWANDAVFARLDRGLPGVRELPGLSDGAVAALVAGARAVLNPSLAEGFGLPAFEAAGRGVPLVCGDLAIWREMLGDTPVYLDPHDRYLWAGTVRSLAGQATVVAPVALPTWEDHFKTVLSQV
ncbi:MAG: glycosyltransferase [Rubellimicrobium sp.]|nr:glycosyltransferase [Rubellimicrobium sp.]